jgi:hypothetical protein
VVPGDVLGEVETDKASVAFDSSEEGYIARLFVEAGTQDISVGEVCFAALLRTTLADCLLCCVRAHDALGCVPSAH